MTGVSGSGKSSLAFDVIYGEGQRRFLDSLSTFAKARINQVKKAKVDFVRGLSPVVAIEQKKSGTNPRSTVGTMTDIYDYLRLLFATAGVGHCPECGCELKQFSPAQMAEHIAALPIGTEVELLIPVQKIFGEDYKYMLDGIRTKGFKNMLIDGKPYKLSDKHELEEHKTYRMEIVVDKFTIRSDMYAQIAKSIETSIFTVGEGYMRIEVKGGAPEGFYDYFACPKHHTVLAELQSFYFSFNDAASACHTCSGIGTSYVVEPRFLIANPLKSINKGGLVNMLYNPASKGSYRGVMVYSLSQHYGFSMDVPVGELGQEAIDILFYGSKGEIIKMVQPEYIEKRNWITGREFAFGGFVRDIEGWYKNYIRKSSTDGGPEPEFLKEVMVENVCPECHGLKLTQLRLSITLGGKHISEVSNLQLPEFVEYLRGLTFDADLVDVGSSIVNEIITRVDLLIDIGLHYLNLSRRSNTISGGEAQRIRMSTQISSELMGMLYVMDEPSIGLHSRDSMRVIDTMKKLRDIGNTLIVVEHDIDTIKNADYIVEIGPGPGIHGGEVVTCGQVEDIAACEGSITGQYLSGKAKIDVPKKRRPHCDKYLTINGARENNLKNVTIDIPLGVFVCVTGVSGSGKSTLINEILHKQMRIVFNNARIVAGEHDSIIGFDQINNVINIDQSPIGRSSRSNPATYIGLYDRIRAIFADTDDAHKRGFNALDFSLTHANGGRCEHCTGDGIITTQLQFMADIETICPVCKGARFSEEALEVKYKGKNISEVLDMTSEEALTFFGDIPLLQRKLKIMDELGLGYIKLGQNSSTLSGGEAQRVKLAYELSKLKRGSHNVYILDEPTTGLHLHDIGKLLICLNKLVDAGHTVLVIEHHLDVIKVADHIIDMGPEGGNGGGYVVFEGTPEDLIKEERSHTGRYLKEVLA